MRRNRQREALWLLAMGALLALGVVLLFKGLGLQDIQTTDEARHGINAYEMVQSGDYVVSTFHGVPDYWNLKPPLSLYGIAAGYRVFGYTALGLRFYSAASMFAMMALLALWMRQNVGRMGSLACQLFLTACTIVYDGHFARAGDADALFVMCYALAMLCMLSSEKDVRWLYGSALCFGLAFMAKSFHAALIPVTCLVYVCVTGSIRRLKPKHYALLVLFGLLPIAPWAIARIRADGLTFFVNMLEKDVFKRASTVVEDHPGDALFYIRYLLRDPACVLAMLALAAAAGYKLVRRRRITPVQWGIGLWFMVPVVLYSLCQSKLHWYVFVSIPALGVFVGLMCQRLSGRSSGFALRTACIALAGCVLLWGTFGSFTLVWNMSAGRYHQLIRSAFDRERDSGTHVYIQYEIEDPDTPPQNTWHPGEECAVLLAADAQCLRGGAEAFCADDAPAYLITHASGRDEALLQGYRLVYDLPPVALYTNDK